MATKCRVLEKKPALNTVVFELNGKPAWICGSFKEYDGFVYIEERSNGALVSVDEPAAEPAPQKKPRARSKKSANSNAVKNEDAIAPEE